jgi:hypothetical protein
MDREASETGTDPFRRGSGEGMCGRGKPMQHGKPDGVVEREDQPVTCEGPTGRDRVTERPIVPSMPGNAGGGKGPWFKADATRSKGREIGQPSNSR